MEKTPLTPKQEAVYNFLVKKKKAILPVELNYASVNIPK